MQNVVFTLNKRRYTKQNKWQTIYSDILSKNISEHIELYRMLKKGHNS